MTKDNSERELDILEEALIAGVTDGRHEIREGVVRTTGPAPYRRLDCDGRALAYVRKRPKKGAVRVDLSGLWVRDRSTPLQFASAGGAAALFVRSREDLSRAMSFLEATVEQTRKALAEEAKKRRSC